MPLKSYKTFKIVPLTVLLLLACWLLYPTNSSEEKPIIQPISEVKLELVDEPIKTPKVSDIEFKRIINQYDSILESILQKNGTLGAAIGIIHNNKIQFIKCHGLRNSKTNQTINEHTVFRLASVSKAVSGILAGMLIEKDFIHLEDKVVDYLPNFKLKDKTSTQNLTIKHLLTHTTGMAPHAFDNLIESKVAFPTVISKLNQINIHTAPGKVYGYQNVAFSLLDPIIESATKKSFETLMKSYVFAPFNMRDASVGFESFANNSNIAYPHQRIGDRKFAQVKLNDRYYSTLPAAGVNASLLDMSQFIQSILASKKHFKSLTETVFSPRIVTPLSRGYLREWGQVQSKHYGLGWRIIGYQDHTIAYHGGYVNGYKTEIAICEEEDFGVVYLSNSPDRTASFSVSTFLKLYFEAITAIENNQKNPNV